MTDSRPSATPRHYREDGCAYGGGDLWRDHVRATFGPSDPATPDPRPDLLRESDRTMAEYSDTRSACPRCGEWRDSPTSDCANCGAAPATPEGAERTERGATGHGEVGPGRPGEKDGGLIPRPSHSMADVPAPPEGAEPRTAAGRALLRLTEDEELRTHILAIEREAAGTPDDPGPSDDHRALSDAARTLVEVLERHGMDNLALFEQQIGHVRGHLVARLGDSAVTPSPGDEE